MTATIDFQVCVCGACVFPVEGSIRSQKLPGSFSASLVQRGLSAGLFRVPQISSGQVQSHIKQIMSVNRDKIVSCERFKF